MPADHYANIDDVNQLVPQATFSATSRPTQQQVERFIEHTAIDMDSILASIGFTPPVTAGARGLAWLRLTCAFGALGMAQDARSTAVATAVSAGGKEVENIWSQRYRQRMKSLSDSQDPTALLDVTTDDEATLKTSTDILRSSVQGVDSDIWTTPEVTRSQVL